MIRASTSISRISRGWRPGRGLEFEEIRGYLPVRAVTFQSIARTSSPGR